MKVVRAYWVATLTVGVADISPPHKGLPRTEASRKKLSRTESPLSPTSSRTKVSFAK